jgi:protein subunit release factor A
MSASISAAKKRRSSPVPQASTNVPQQGGMTLTQVIALIDTRLINLEKTSETVSSNLNPESVEKFENRFDILAEEISNLKQIVLSLQSYTMDVNRILYEEKLNRPQSDKDILFNVISTEHPDIANHLSTELTDI